MWQYVDSAFLPSASHLNGWTCISDLSFVCIEIFEFIYSRPDIAESGTEG